MIVISAWLAYFLWLREGLKIWGGCSEVLAVATDRQTAGRGTHGRKWVDKGGGNAASTCVTPRHASRGDPQIDRATPYSMVISTQAVTVAIARDAVPLSPLTLVPLRVGLEVARVLDAHLVDSRCRVTCATAWKSIRRHSARRPSRKSSCRGDRSRAASGQVVAPQLADLEDEVVAAAHAPE